MITVSPSVKDKTILYHILLNVVVLIQSLSCIQLCDPMDGTTPGYTVLHYLPDQIRSDQSLSPIRLFATPWIAARQASLSITNSRSSLRLMSIESVMPSSHLILCRRLLLLPPIPPSIRVFSNESTLRIRWPKYWSFRTPRADLLQNGLVGSPGSPRDSQESSPTPQFKSINSLALSLLHSPTLTSIHISPRVCSNHAHCVSDAI